MQSWALTHFDFDMSTNQCHLSRCHNFFILSRCLCCKENFSLTSVVANPWRILRGPNLVDREMGVQVMG